MKLIIIIIKYRSTGISIIKNKYLSRIILQIKMLLKPIKHQQQHNKKKIQNEEKIEKEMRRLNRKKSLIKNT